MRNLHHLKSLVPSIAIAAFLMAPPGPVLALPANVTVVAANLWVDATAGNDANSGTSSSQAFRTIQAAATLAGPGTTVHIMPGVYRESVVPAADGGATAPIVYKAELGPGTVTVRGSSPSSSLTWSRLASNTIGLPSNVSPANIYYADLSGWGLTQPPRFVVTLNGAGQVVSRYMPAREPDSKVLTPWKVSEFWWMANGGSAVASCNPDTNSNHQCDLPSRSYTLLTDTTNDTAPAGVEAGNLTTMGKLVGATLVALDARHGHYIYRGTITAHDVASGRITVNQKFDDDGSPGLGWGTKYYVENHPALLNQPGEWWFDLNTNRLYFWSPGGANPAQLNLEISRRNTGFDLSRRSYITLDGLTIELFNQRAYSIWNSNATSKAFGNVIQNCTLRYANQGVVLYQYMNSSTPSTYAIDNFTLQNSEIAYMDTVGIDSSYWWQYAPSPAQFNHSGVRNVVVQDNNLHDLAFNSDARVPVGVRIQFPDKLRLTGNTVDNTAHAGVHLLWSLIASAKQWGFSPQEIKIGNILIAGNVFDHTCMLSSDCGALKVSGSKRPDTHVFRDVLVTGNVFRNSFGWSFVSMLRDKTNVGDANGFYLDNASGVHVYRNISYNNTGAGFKLSCLWRDGDSIFYNNIAANNYMFGFKLTGAGSCDNHNGSIDTEVVNNILVNNEAFAMQVFSAYNAGNYGNLTIDHNLYFKNGWNTEAGYGNPADIQLFEGTQSGQYFHTVAEIQSGTPWESHGLEGDPAFTNYDPADHNRYDNSWPDFHLTSASSNAIDRGTVDLPASLAALLTAFSISDTRAGASFDIGRFESASIAPAFSASPTSWNYGMVQAGMASAGRVFTIQNSGRASMAIGPVSLAGTNADQFQLTSDSCSNASVAPNGTCAVTVAFLPSTSGAKTASITFPDNAGGPHAVSLTGKGAAELVLNGGFNQYPSGAAMIPSQWTAASFGPNDGKDTTIMQEGTASIEISNTSSLTKALAQKNLISGTTGNAFQLSVWGRGQNIPSTSGLVRVVAKLLKGTMVVQTATLNFPAGTYSFQQKTLTFKAAGAYDQILIRLVYSKPRGTVWFDGVSLLRSP